jgi:hypothetical protein
MSLLRLLSTGKSWVGLKHGPARYEMSDPRALPKFNPGKNPFLAKAAVKIEPPTPETAPISSPALTNAPTASTSSPNNGLSSITRAPSNPSGGASAKPRSLIGTIFAPVRWIFRRKTPSPALRKLSPLPRVAVQGELSLDSIKVVRNDLCDADVEIVPARTTAPLNTATEKMQTPVRPKQSAATVAATQSMISKEVERNEAPVELSQTNKF